MYKNKMKIMLMYLKFQLIRQFYRTNNLQNQVKNLLDQRLEHFSHKEPDNKYFSLSGHRVFISTIQLCCCSMEAAIDNI